MRERENSESSLLVKFQSSEFSIATPLILWNDPPMRLFPLLILSIYAPFAFAQEKPKIPLDLLENQEFLDEYGVNEFTAPSIAKVFDELEKVAPLTYNSDHLKIHERLPLDRSRLALRLGTLIADGFIAVQTGNADDVPDIASHISRYAKALGAGERVKKHVSSLLEFAQAKDLVNLKRALSATQLDVESELASLRDPDLSHLISLGGWLQALHSASSSVNAKFTPEKGVTLFREDIADYYSESIGGLNPEISGRPYIKKMRELLHGLRNAMVLDIDTKPTAKQVAEVNEVAIELAQIALK